MIDWTSRVEHSWTWDGQHYPDTDWTLQTVEKAADGSDRYILTVLQTRIHYQPRKTVWWGLFWSDEKVERTREKGLYRFIGDACDEWRYLSSFGVMDDERKVELLDRWLEKWKYEFIR